MARTITVAELELVRAVFDCFIRDGLPGWHSRYEDTLDKLIALARPEMLEAWKREQEPALFDPNPESPPAPRSPGAAGGAAGLIPTGGALITEEGLFDALTALHVDLTDGHFQPSLRDWPGEIHAYVMGYAARQSEAAEAAE